MSSSVFTSAVWQSNICSVHHVVVVVVVVVVLGGGKCAC